MRALFYTHSLVSDWNHGNAHFLRGVLRELQRLGHETRVLEPANGWSRTNLMADAGRAAEGTVVEAKLDRGRGPVATVLVQRGTLQTGDIVVAGSEWGRVRALVSDIGAQVKEAGPSVPVEVLGFNGTPEAGDRVVVVENEARAREARRALDLAADGTVLLHFGLLRDYKNVPHLIRMFKQAALPDTTLVIAGRPYDPDIEREVDVIEEVARLYGYDRIPEPARTTIPTTVPEDAPRDVLKPLHIKRQLLQLQRA